MLPFLSIEAAGMTSIRPSFGVPIVLRVQVAPLSVDLAITMSDGSPAAVYVLVGLSTLTT